MKKNDHEKRDISPVSGFGFGRLSQSNGLLSKAILSTGEILSEKSVWMEVKLCLTSYPKLNSNSSRILECFRVIMNDLYWKLIVDHMTNLASSSIQSVTSKTLVTILIEMQSINPNLPS